MATPLFADLSNSNQEKHHGSPSIEEYSTLLKNHLGVMESELSRIKSSQTTSEAANFLNGYSTEVGLGDENERIRVSNVVEGDAQAQEAKIYRVPPRQWREVKGERALNPALPVLIVSSKGQGRVGRRPAGRGNTRDNATSTNERLARHEDSPSDVAYRLAINSRILLNLLSQCTGVDFPEELNVWVRPFKYLVAFETEIRRALEDAESAFGQVEAGSGLPNQAYAPQNSTEANSQGSIPVEHRGDAKSDATTIPPHPGAVNRNRAKAERDQLRCLVNFMDTDMQDIFDVKRQITNNTLEEIAFEHLWLLYNPGDLVFSFKSLGDISTYQAYHVLHVTGGRLILDTMNVSEFRPVYGRNWDEESESEERARDVIRSSLSSMTPFIIDCFYIDFDGNRLGSKSRRIVIGPYSDKRKVQALELYPSLLHPQHEIVHQTMVKRGQRFTQLARGTHKLYSGPTLKECRELWEAGSSPWNYIIHDEEVHSEIMLDQEASITHFRKTIPRWRFKLGGPIIAVPTEADRREIFDPLPEDKSDKDRYSDVFDDSIIDLDRRSDYIESTTLLRERRILGPSLTEEYVMLLPFRMYGYAMLNRKWFPLNINLVTDITPDQVRTTAAGYDDLVLPEGHKKLLQAVVKNQTRDPKQISGERDKDTDEFQMDIVRGKGKGLIILLHGAPGVGKSSTAECVASQLQRPLLSITCGDISTSVGQAEETLQEYCALAYRWRCVLLLDEADVFLAKREKGDITRNALVSVFLRVLEYFSGVIVLTTNRVGEFDEAFTSRIHIKLYYPKLDEGATLEIWGRSLLRLRKSGLRLDFSEDEITKFAKKQWLDNEDKPSRHWNGRQIKNAFQTALALANWEYYETKQGQKLDRPLLKAKHFERVAKTSAHFDDYISDIHGISEDTWSVLAGREGIRKDTHPTMSLVGSQSHDPAPRSQRTTPARRGAEARVARTGDGMKAEAGGDKVRELELELELLKLKQANGKEEVQQARAGDDEDDEW